MATVASQIQVQQPALGLVQVGVVKLSCWTACILAIAGMCVMPQRYQAVGQSAVVMGGVTVSKVMR